MLIPDRDPMRETAGGAALLVADDDWTNAIDSLLAMNTARRAELIATGIANARQYSVKRMAQGYIAFYKQFLP